MDFLIAILPIALLAYVITKKNPWPVHLALPAAAGLVYFSVLVWFRADPNLVNATVVNGALSALTPLSIIWGAILLAQTIHRSGAERVIGQRLNYVSPNPVAQLMIIGWAMAFMIEGSSGFGTPAAIAAPLLVGLGFEPLGVAVLTLVMNSVPVTFGAVGTPMWFGLGSLGLSETELLSIGWKSALGHSVAALIVPLLALRLVVSWKEIRGNLLYIYLSILSCTVPYLILSRFSVEFPTLMGGAVGLALSVILAKMGVGLAPHTTGKDPAGPAPSRRQTLLAFSPYLLLIAILVITRLPQLPVRAWLNAESPNWMLSLGTLGQLSVSAALVFKFAAIFGTQSQWTFNALYVPAIIPFVLVVLLSMPILKINARTVWEVAADTTRKLANPALMLVGALIMVQLMMVGGENAQVIVIGRVFSTYVGKAWPFFAACLGALGSFFAGSATVSNLTFGGIQLSVAKTLGFDPTLILALQGIGAAMGNMICISNIVAVATVINLANRVDFILKRAVMPFLVYALVAGLVGLAAAWLRTG
jgi:lactate permease